MEVDAVRTTYIENVESDVHEKEHYKLNNE